jgi:hypothetical protein
MGNRQEVLWDNGDVGIGKFDTFNNLDRAAIIHHQISELRGIQKDLKDAFYHRALDGGPKAAEQHPLYLQAAERILELQEALTLLI